MAPSQERYGCSAQIPRMAPPRRKEAPRSPRANACTFTFIVTTVLSKLKWYEETFLKSPNRPLSDSWCVLCCFSLAALPPVDGRASPVPQHRSQVAKWGGLHRDSTLLPRANDASYGQRSSGPLIRARYPRCDAVHPQWDSQLLRRRAT